MKSTLLALCIASVLAPPVVGATTSAQDHINALELRIKTLEANAEAMRLQAEAAAAALAATREEIEAIKLAQSEVVTASQAAPEAEVTPVASENAFNPAISVVLNGFYNHHSLDPASYQRSGFPLVGEGAPSAQGLSLGESEVSLAANIDEKFRGQLTLALGADDSLGIEEAYIDSTSLPGGVTVRVGRFFSNIGYLNSHHAHSDKFSDRPLASQAFVGNQYGDDGVQLRWIAPTDIFIELGGEILRGQNFPSGGAGQKGIGVKTLFAHAGGDVGIENSWLAGVSMLESNTAGAEDGFRGNNKLFIADATWKWAPQGNFKDGGITLRGEYFLDDRDGQYIDADNSALDQVWMGKRRGAYIEAIYRINRNWETGYRYDALWADDSGPYASTYDPRRHSLMLTWLNSEFSLLRLQYSHDQPQASVIDNVLTLQYQVSLGAHGAHKF